MANPSRTNGPERGEGAARSSNAIIARRLAEAATLLDQQGANPYRARAYRWAARSVRLLGRDLAELAAQDGATGLMAIPGIGPSIARAIMEQLETGRWAFLDMLRGRLVPERLFTSVPGIGPVLSRRIYDRLGIATLEALEAALKEGRLREVPGIGPRRAALVRIALAGVLDRLRPRRGGTAVWEEPSVAVLLDVDSEYRRKAAADALPRIAPRRFNPQRIAWLPMLHTRRGRWRVSALYSNTALAHELGRTHDWVVLYFHADGGPEAQRTIVTETDGPLAGKRVVRGREGESLAYYARHAQEKAPAEQPA